MTLLTPIFLLIASCAAASGQTLKVVVADKTGGGFSGRDVATIKIDTAGDGDTAYIKLVEAGIGCTGQFAACASCSTHRTLGSGGMTGSSEGRGEPHAPRQGGSLHLNTHCSQHNVFRSTP